MKRQTSPLLAARRREVCGLGSGVIGDGCGAGVLPARPQARRLHHKTPHFRSLPHTGGIQTAIASFRKIPHRPAAKGTPHA